MSDIYVDQALVIFEETSADSSKGKKEPDQSCGA